MAIINSPRIRVYFADETVYKSIPETARKNIYLVSNLSKSVDRAVHVVVYFSVYKANPNGDLDSGGAPRYNIFDNKGFVTADSSKRHVRDAVHMIYGLPMHVGHPSGVLLTATVEAAREHCSVGDSGLRALEDYMASENGVKVENIRKSKEDEGKKSVDYEGVVKANLSRYFDDRTFGRVFASKMNLGIRGAVQYTTATSLHPIEVTSIAITSDMVANEKEKISKSGRNVGRYQEVNFGLYHYEIFVNPFQARMTGFTWNDLNLLLNGEALKWELTKASRRSSVELEAGYIFISDSHLNVMRTNKAKKLTTPKDLSGLGPVDARKSMGDYEMVTREEIKANLPPNLKLLLLDE